MRVKQITQQQIDHFYETLKRARFHFILLKNAKESNRTNDRTRNAQLKNQQNKQTNKHAFAFITMQQQQNKMNKNTAPDNYRPSNYLQFKCSFTVEIDMKRILHNRLCVCGGMKMKRKTKKMRFLIRISSFI